MSQVFRDQGNSPYGLTYHGYDQKVTLYALADADGIEVGDLVQVSYGGNLMEASKTLTLAANQIVWRGVVIGFQNQRREQDPTQITVKTGDLLEIQVGGLAEGVKFPAAVAAGDGHVLLASISGAYSTAAAETVTRFASSLAYAWVDDDVSTTVKDLRFLGRFLRS